MGGQQSVVPGDPAPSMLVTGASTGIGFALATCYAKKVSVPAAVAVVVRTH